MIKFLHCQSFSESARSFFSGAPQPPLFSQLPSIPPFPAPPSINPDLLTGFPNMPPVSQPAATEQQAVSSTPKTDQTSASAYQSQAPVSYTPTSAQQYQQQPTSMTNTPPKPESVTPSAPMMPPTIDFSKLPPLNFPPGMNPPPMFSMNNPNIPHLMTTMQAKLVKILRVDPGYSYAIRILICNFSQN